PFRVSNLGRKAAVAALQDKAYYDNLTKTTAQIRDNFIAQMNTLANVKAFKSAANFVFIHFDNSIDTQKLKDYLALNGILVRLWTENGQLAMRVTVAPKEWMDKAFNLIKEFLGK
ncbi:MAG: histidinol-phosphate aminotransferase, partial [Treponema sp.]|nr:histidinol-phosphate aminotransferase [Treponema sp.]